MVEIIADDHAHHVAVARQPAKVIDASNVHHLLPVPGTDKFLYVGKTYHRYLEEFKRDALLTETL